MDHFPVYTHYGGGENIFERFFFDKTFFVKPPNVYIYSVRAGALGLQVSFLYSVTVNRDLQYRNLKRNDMLKRTFNRRN
jgi:ABC-type sugar transport system permease subunit